MNQMMNRILLRKIKIGINVLISDSPLFFNKLMMYTYLLFDGALLRLLKMVLLKRSTKRSVNNVIFEYDFSLSDNIADMYCGTYAFNIVQLMKKILKPGDIFIDVGANIGYISAVGAGLVGKTGQVHSFEPAFPYFKKLEKLAKINLGYKIIVNQYALGDKEETAGLLLSKEDIGCNTISSYSHPRVDESVEISIRRLDNYIKENRLSKIALIKIDVEGFEFHVLKGLSNYFENTNQRPIIICEICPFWYPKYGATLNQLLDFMKLYGYEAFNPCNLNIKIDFSKFSAQIDAVFKL